MIFIAGYCVIFIRCCIKVGETGNLYFVTCLYPKWDHISLELCEMEEIELNRNK